MTVIDRLSFRFGTEDEAFARALYAAWDEFCRHCVMEVLEGFFTRFDRPESYFEIDRLDLDLGGIPQERFRELFPVRLREALERSFGASLQRPAAVPNHPAAVPNRPEPAGAPPAAALNQPAAAPNRPEPAGAPPAAASNRPERSASAAREKRFENLLHYLANGFCLPAWERPDFDLYEELRSCLDLGYGSRLFSALEPPHVLARLYGQLDAPRLEKLLFGASGGSGEDSFLAMLCAPAAGLGRQGRQRLLFLMLETAPQRVTRFIHAPCDTGGLDALAGLLEDPHVRRIMAAETEAHAEIGVPEYWHRLYGWLIAYYPFNGVPMFGDKQHFRLHLNRKLLAFIHKRDSAVYLSRADLTLRFLLEVFGAEHYRPVLEILYRNQPLNGDGTPASGDSYAWELYDILRRLSLLATGTAGAGHSSRHPTGIRPEEPPPSAEDRSAAANKAATEAATATATEAANEAATASALPPAVSEPEEERFERWAAWLLCPSVSDAEKSQRLRHYARWQPALLWRFVRYAAAEEAGRGPVAAARWSSWLGAGDWLEMISGVSPALGETLRRRVETLSGTGGADGRILAEGLVRLVASCSAERIRLGSGAELAEEYSADVIARSAERIRLGSGAELAEEYSAAVIARSAERIRLGSGAELAERYSADVIARSAERGTPVRGTPVRERPAGAGEERGAKQEEPAAAVQPEYIEVPNAGLCLLALWFPRLFGMLDLLTADRRALKDTEARIRAVFILQRIVTDEPRTYREQELAFNRLLAGCPFWVPLPGRVALTDRETATAESLLAGVKSNWEKLKNTSIKGFRQSFIERPGRLEQRGERWVLYVESRSYDILLDSLPWSCRTIRLPWLKKSISVIWRDKETFDFM